MVGIDIGIEYAAAFILSRHNVSTALGCMRCHMSHVVVLSHDYSEQSVALSETLSDCS